MEFGICFKGSMDHNRMKHVVKQAEYAGFSIVGFMTVIFFGEKVLHLWLCVLSIQNQCDLDLV